MGYGWGSGKGGNSGTPPIGYGAEFQNPMTNIAASQPGGTGWTAPGAAGNQGGATWQMGMPPQQQANPISAPWPAPSSGPGKLGGAPSSSTQPSAPANNPSSSIYQAPAGSTDWTNHPGSFATLNNQAPMPSSAPAPVKTSPPTIANYINQNAPELMPQYGAIQMYAQSNPGMSMADVIKYFKSPEWNRYNPGMAAG